MATLCYRIKQDKVAHLDVPTIYFTPSYLAISCHRKSALVSQKLSRLYGSFISAVAHPAQRVLVPFVIASGFKDD